MNTLYSTKHLYPTVTRGGLEEVTVHCFHLQMLPHVAYLLRPWRKIRVNGS